ncbi:MAG: amylo-alpha-1,6-glucosidase, partial [Rhodothermales bacterium]|nr:amylo-alpha-1,6-glucosidase [Rhodothermales bacterium]
PLDARIRAVTVNDGDVPFETVEEGDVLRAVITAELGAEAEVVIRYDEGTAAFVRHEAPAPGATSGGLRILRDRSEGGALRLVLEGVGGRAYTFGVRTPHRVEAVPGVTVRSAGRLMHALEVAFEEGPTRYVRRTIALPLGPSE